ncbi:MAG: choice-of-anchor D domain-containing protein [Candidatus Eisenbacteria bacterium]|uniref:Choice-of-anchor D domain-containing protein n=1 Tax=Eiseniibacteriota bacterium TaxID=2212470 RepID=A0A849SN52_UNCEI|nr:choice-of-anchor D domain-containing protein [Candidatus Eisenbacteria bacterium]
MRRIAPLLVCLLALLAATSTVSQAVGFHAVHSKDGTHVWAVGDSGAIFRSYDSGITYVKNNLGTAPLRGVAHRQLVPLIVGDGGVVWRSTNNGGTFASQVASASDLNAVSMPTDLVAIAVGDAGTILRSTDAGASWNAQVSGSGANLFGVAFTNADDGWAVGASGTLLRTTNGGASWNPVALGSTAELLSVAQHGSRVWAVGRGATAFKSTDSGANWNAVNLRTDARPDVRAVALDATRVILGGGGGFVRSSVDDGTTWTFPIHSLHGQVSGIGIAGGKTFAASNVYNVVLRDSSATNWVMQRGGGVTRTWLKMHNLSNGFRGLTMDYNYLNPNIIYVMSLNSVRYSPNRGETWSTIATTTLSSDPNAFIVSDRDTNTFIAAVSLDAGGRGVIRSTDRGATWSTTHAHEFGTYGIPLEQHPDRPDTLIFGGDDDVLQISTDRGATWSDYGTQVFRSPCDIIVLPDSNDVWQVGDGITGSGIGELFRSTNNGLNFSLRQNANGSEVPGMSTSRLRKERTYASTWSAAGARATSDGGNTWPTISALAGYGSSWGTDVAKDDPNVVVIGQYSGGSSRFSLDGGISYQSIPLNGTNYSFLMVDRATIFAQQSDSLFKMRFNYNYTPATTQSLTVASPNGGESLARGAVVAINWNSTNIGLARVEWRENNASSWQLISEVPGYLGTFAWTVPDVPTTQAQVRVLDAWDSAPQDESNATFTILAPRMVVTPGNLSFGSHAAGNTALLPVTVQSTGTVALIVTSVSTGTAAFTEGRISLTIAPAASDSIGVTFRPTAGQGYVDSLTIVSDAGTVKVPLDGTGTASGALTVLAPGAAQTWKYGTTHPITWLASGITQVGIDYRTAPNLPWELIADNIDATLGTFDWVIPNAQTTTGAVRVRDMGGSITDVSEDDLAITVPGFNGLPTPLDLGAVEINTAASGAFLIANPGTAFLGVLGVASDNPRFVPHRTTFAVTEGDDDTLGVTYNAPGAAGADSATITVTTDDPAGSHTLKVLAQAQALVAVGDPNPVAFALRPNLPNPFSRSTSIRYALPTRASVRLEVFDLQGHRIATLVDTQQEAGEYAVSFGPGAANRGSSMGRIAAGVYFYRLTAGTFRDTRRMLVLP